MKSRVQGDQFFGHIAKQKSSLPMLYKPKSRAGFEVDQIDGIYVRKNVLGFVMAALKGSFREVSASRHTDAGRHLFRNLGALAPRGIFAKSHGYERDCWASTTLKQARVKRLSFK